MVKRNWLAGVALTASVLAFGVIGLGAFTRLTDAGLGCPDWPGCYGHFIAPLDQSYFKAWAEMIHRYFAGLLSVLIVITVTLSFISRQRNNVILATLLLLLVIYQILLGQWTVTLKLLPVVVTQHLLGGYLILISLWLLYLENRSHKTLTPSYSKTFSVAGIIAFLLIFIQIFLGAWTSTNYASLSCPDFPVCVQGAKMVWNVSQAFDFVTGVGRNYENGLLSESARQTIQMMHRFGALIVTIYLVALSFLAMRRYQENFTILKIVYLMIGLLCLQISLGMYNLFYQLPLFTAVAHTWVAVLLLLTAMTFAHAVSKGGQSWQR